jgi:hypothetical protein
MPDKTEPSRPESIDEQRKAVYERLRRMKRAYDASYDFGRRIDEALDFLTLPGNIEKIKMPGLPNTRCCQHLILDKEGGILAEVDGLLGHDSYFLGIKMCTWLFIEEIDQHIKQLKTFSRVYAEDKVVCGFRGCVSGAIISEPAKKYAQEMGLYVLEAVGDTLKLDVPEGFTARIW